MGSHHNTVTISGGGEDILRRNSRGDGERERGGRVSRKRHQSKGLFTHEQKWTKKNSDKHKQTNKGKLKYRTKKEKKKKKVSKKKGGVNLYVFSHQETKP